MLFHVITIMYEGGDLVGLLLFKVNTVGSREIRPDERTNAACDEGHLGFAARIDRQDVEAKGR